MTNELQLDNFGKFLIAVLGLAFISVIGLILLSAFVWNVEDMKEFLSECQKLGLILNDCKYLRNLP